MKKKLLLLIGIIFLSTLSFSQQFEWVKDLSETNPNNIEVIDIEINSSGQVYVLGNFEGTVDLLPGNGAMNLTSYGGKDLFIVKYDSDGDILSVFHSGNSGLLSNVNSDEVAQDMVMDASGNIYVTGYFESDYYFEPYFHDCPGDCILELDCNYSMFVAELNSSLHVQWATEPYDCYEDMDEVAIKGEKLFYHSGQDAVYVAGHFQGYIALSSTISISSNDGTNQDVFFAKVGASSLSPFTLGKSLNSSTDKAETIAGIAVRPAGNYIYIAGSFAGNLDMDPGASINNLTSSGSDDIYLARYSSSGTYSSSYVGKIGGSSSDIAKSLEMDLNGNLFLAGEVGGSNNTIDFDIKAGTKYYTTTAKDAFVVKYDSLLNYQWKLMFSGVNDQYMTGAKTDNQNRVCVMGSFYNTCNVNPNGTAHNLTSLSTGTNLFFGKYNNSTGVEILTKQLGGEQQLYYNFAFGVGKYSSDMVLYGKYIEMLDFDPGPAIGYSSPTTYQNGRFLAKYSICNETSISADPENTTICDGENTSFFCEVDAGTNFTYQWKKDGSDLINGGDISGVNNSMLYLENVANSDEGTYTCLIESSCWVDATSNGGELIVNDLPTVSSQPSNTTICEGGNASFSISALGAGLVYKWLVNEGSGSWQEISNGGVYSGSTTSTLSITAATASMSYFQYKCMVTGSCNPLANSHTAILIVNPATAIQAQPSNAIVCQNQSTNFSVVATGGGLTYQWQYSLSGGSSYTNLPNNTTFTSTLPTLTINPVSSSWNGMLLRCVVSGNCGSNQTSDAAVMTVKLNPAISSQPINRTICENESTNFSITATGSDISYQWQVNQGSGYSDLANNSIYTNVTSATLNILVGYTSMDGYKYKCIVTGACNPQATSSEVTLTVSPSPIATITADDVTDFCSGGSVGLTSSSSSGNTYQWQRNGVDISGETTTTYTVTEGGNYTIDIENSFNCISSSAITTVNVYPVPSAEITTVGNSEFCEGNSVELLVGTGSGYSYQWKKDNVNISNANGTSYTANVSGDYSVYVTNTFDCDNTSLDETITVNSLPTATISAGSSTTFCQGGNVTLSANTGEGLTYQWKRNGISLTGETSSTYYATLSGQYTVDVTNASSCLKTSLPINVTVNPIPSAVITVVGNSSFCDGSSTELTVGTGSGYSYQWKLDGSNINGAIGSSYTASNEGDYSVQVTSNYSCVSTSSAETITVNPLPVATITPATSTSFCNGGSVVLNANTGAGLTYVWKKNSSVITGQTTSSYSATTAGNYLVIVTNANGCETTSASESVYVNPNPSPVITAVGSTEFCEGNSVNLTVGTGTGYSYQWAVNSSDITGATSSSNYVISSGSYTVEITSLYGCSTTSAAKVVTVNALPIAEITPAGATSFCDGSSVVLNANTGTGLTYVWKKNNINISGETSSSLTVEETGNYTVKISNANSCSKTSDIETITIYSKPTSEITVVGNTEFCSGESSILTVGSEVGYSYQWANNGTNITGANSSSYSVSNAGNYTVSVTNLYNCSTNSSGQAITVNTLPTAAITPASTTTFCDGDSVVLNANTGAGLTYVWKNNNINISGEISSSLTVNETGDYTVKISNANSCSQTSEIETITVYSNPTSVITAIGNTSFCEGSSVELTVGTGTGYSYQWGLDGSNISGAIGSSITATTEGDYSVSVTNFYGCSTNSANKSITVNALPTATITPASATTFCAGNNVILNANTGAGLTYVWKKNNIDISGETSSSLTVEETGNYTVKISNANSCSQTSEIETITVYSNPTSVITAIGNTSFCNGGSVELTVGTGTGYSYQWALDGSNISGAIGSSITATTEGDYSVSVTNFYGCSTNSANKSITVNALPTAEITPAGSITFCDGSSVVLNANTGTGLTYVWKKNNINISGQTSSSLTVDETGNYKVEVTNSNLCTAISNSEIITVNPNPISVITVIGNSEFCEGNNIELTVGTSSGYSYQWIKNGTNITGGIGSSLTVSTSGDYTVSVTNTYSCSSVSNSETITVNSSPTATITPNGDIEFCNGGTVDLNANTGAGLNYSWIKNGNIISNETSSLYSAQSSGNYSVIVTDANGCSKNSSIISVTVNSLPDAVITSALSAICQGASLPLEANVGTDYTYQWKANTVDIPLATSSIYTASNAASYTVEVTNASGCSKTSGAKVITVNPLPNVAITANNSTSFCFGESVGLSATNNASYIYQWYKNGGVIVGQNTSNTTVSSGGTYFAGVTSTLTGCANVSNSITVSVGAIPEAVITAIGETEICQGNSTELIVGAATGNSYQWKFNNVDINGAVGSALTAEQNGSYTVEVTNSDNCTALSNSQAIIVNPIPITTVVANGTAEFCQGESVVLSTTEDAGYTYKWKRNGLTLGSETSFETTAALGGYYSVEITSSNNCVSESANTLVTVNSIPVAVITVLGEVALCEGNTVEMLVSSGNNYFYQWKNNDVDISGATSASYTTNVGGDFTVEISSADGCSNTSSIQNITVYDSPNIVIVPANSTTFCEGGNVVLNANNTGFVSYQWKRNGLNISGQTATSYTATNSGNYSVFVTDVNACAATSSLQSVVASARPDAVITAFGDTTFCEGNSVELLVGSGTGYTYQWQLNSSNISGATSAVYNAELAGNISVIVSDAGGCSNTSEPIIITTIESPDVSIIVDGELSFCTGNTTILKVNRNVNVNYQWQRLGANINGATDTAITVQSNGTYTITASNINCSSVSQPVSINVYPLPSAAVIPMSSTEFCFGDSLQLDANAGAGLSYMWKKDGNLLIGENLSLIYASETGGYSVVVTNSNYCSRTSSPLTVTVNEIPEASITASSDTEFCNGESVNLVSNTGSGYTYQWQVAGVDIAGANSSVYTATNAGNYTVEIMNPENCSSISTATAVSIFPSPVVYINTNSETNFCSGDSANLVAYFDATYQYQWLKYNTVITNENTQNYTATTSGNYKARVTNEFGCTATSQIISITVSPAPDAIITAMGNTEFCQGNSISLSVGTSTGNTYQWLKNNSEISGQTGSSITANTSGDYSVLVYNSNNCSATSEATTVTVLANPNTAITIVGETTYCVGDSLVLSVQNNANYLYQWKLNGTDIVGAYFNELIRYTSGQYSVLITDVTTNCFATSSYINSIVNNNPNPIIVDQGTLTLCVTDTVNLSTSINYVGYLWSTNETIPTINIIEQTNVHLTVTDYNGCTGATEIDVVENELESPKICLVTFDNTEDKNLVLWEKNSASIDVIESYNIYRLEGSDFQLIGNGPAADDGIFLDLSSMPFANAEIYKISANDTCGNESALSDYHQTMNLSIVSGLTYHDVSLIWNKYIDGSGTYTPDYYYIYRGMTNSTMMVHDSISGYLSDYNVNINDAASGEKFLISIHKDACIVTGANKQMSGPYDVGLSNIEDNILAPTDVAELKSGNTFNVSVFPNPFSETTNFEYTLQEKSDITLSLSNILGEQIAVLKQETELEGNHKYKLNTKTLNLNSGIYFISLSVNGEMVTKKVVVE